jgi:hypothetical protein
MSRSLIGRSAWALGRTVFANRLMDGRLVDGRVERQRRGE